MKKLNKNIFTAIIITLFLQGIFPQAKTAFQYYSEGLTAQNEESWYEASQHFMEAIQKNPVYGDAWFHLAQCSYQLGEFDLTLTQLDEAEKYSRGANSINNLRGMTYIAMQEFSKAR